MFSPELAGTLFPLIAAVSIAAVAFAILYPMFSGDRQGQQRMASVTESRASKLAVRSAAESAANRRKQVSEKLKDIDDRQQENKKVSLRVRLQQAGLTITTQTFWITSAGVGAALGLLVFISLETGMLSLVSTLVAVFVGMFGIPRWFLNRLIRRRQAKFLKEMANAMDVVVRGVKSGLPLNECLQIIARESPDPISTEFTEVVEQQRVGVPLQEALERLGQRMPLPEVRFLSIVIGIQQSSGGNLSEALGNLSDVLRDRTRMKMKVKALSAEATASAAVLASLPPGVGFMLYLTSPNYLAPLITTTVGHFTILAGAFWMMCGCLIMRKMINFKF